MFVTFDEYKVALRNAEVNLKREELRSLVLVQD